MKRYLFLFCSVASIAALSTSAQNISSIAGNGSYGFSGDGGPATAAQFEYIWYAALGGAGSFYFTDNANHRIRKVDGAGYISTIAGNGGPGFSGDGGPATAAVLTGPSGIAVDGAGNVYAADASLRRVRKINTSGIITTIAGTGTAGSGGDGGPATAAQLNSPYGLLADGAGNIYIADAGNSRIRKIDASGIINTIAGNGIAGFGGDGGPATAAKLSSPAAIALDFQGNLYIADVSNNRIRKVSNTGIITTIAGSGTAGYSGDFGAATAAEINQPLSVSVDGLGNVMISDQFNNRIRKVDQAGIITTLAGTGVSGFSGDGGPANLARIRQPFGIMVDSAGDQYICDWGNYRVRKISYNNHLPAFIAGVTDSVVMCENDGPVSIDALLQVTDTDTPQAITWSVISGAFHGTAVGSYTTASTGGLITPAGLTYTPATGYSGRDTFIVRVDDGLAIDTITIYVRIKPLPVLSPVSGPSVVCIGTPATFSDTATGGVWHCFNSNATVSATGVVNGLILGTDSVIYVKTVAGCTSSESAFFSIYPIIDSFSGPSVVCFGLAVMLTGYPAGGTWSNTNGAASVVGGYVTGITPGVDTIVYSVTNPCGTATFRKEMTVNALIAPVVVISASPGAFIIHGETDTLTANLVSGGGIAYSYQWQLNGTNIPGATDSFYISSTFADADSVTCIVTNGPCAASSFGWIYIVYVNNGVPVTGHFGELAHIIPNPNNGSFQVEGTIFTSNDKATLLITDVAGRVVKNEDVAIVNGVLKKNIELPDNLDNGMYLLHIMTDGKRITRKFVINR